MAKPDPLLGEGPRPANPWVRIIWASHRGHGCNLSADDCIRLSLDDAIATAAISFEYPEPDEDI